MERNLKILVVDDFATMRKIVTNFLTKMEFSDITEVENGKLAWELIQEKEFDLIITDYNMPEMTGAELLAKIRNEYHKKNQKVIMVSAETDKDILVTTKSLQVDAYILKPFKLETLRDKIYQIFGYM